MIRIILMIALKLGFKVSDGPNTTLKAVKMDDTPNAVRYIHVIANDWYTPEKGHMIYTWRTVAEMEQNAPVTAYYWRDNASPQGYGPFDSVLSCMNHHAWLIKLGRNGTQSVPQTGGQLVRVDFRGKKRLDN